MGGVGNRRQGKDGRRKAGARTGGGGEGNKWKGEEVGENGERWRGWGYMEEGWRGKKGEEGMRRKGEEW